MSISACDPSLETPQSAPAQPLAEPEPEVTELSKVSETQGGILGLKFDSGLGWQYY